MQVLTGKHGIAVFGGFILAAMLIAGGGCSGSDNGNDKTGSTNTGAKQGAEAKSIQVKGSNTLLQLGQKWAEVYKNETGVVVSVDGLGSGTGIAALIDGQTDIAAASRGMKPEETAKAKANGHEAVETRVAQDGLTVIVNPTNPVSQLTVAQLGDIFTGKIKNWKQVGGNDLAIELNTRDASSGTYVFFLEHILRHGHDKGPEQYADSAMKQQSTQAIADAVATDKGAIGYVGMGYADPKKQKSLKIAKDDKSPYVEPTVANVLNKTYPVSRPLFYYTPGQPAGEVKKYIDWILSDKGQAIVKDLGFVPIK